MLIVKICGSDCVCLCKIEDQKQTPCWLFVLWSICADAVAHGGAWETHRVIRGSVSPRCVLLKPSGTWLCAFSVNLCVWLRSKKGKLSSSHMNKTRHHSLGSPIFTTVSEAVHTYQPLLAPASIRTFGQTDTHRHRQTERETLTHKTVSLHIQRLGLGPKLLPSGLYERRKSPKEPQSQPTHCYYPAHVFSSSFFRSIKTSRGSRTTITRREVCNYSIARQAGQR